MNYKAGQAGTHSVAVNETGTVGLGSKWGDPAPPVGEELFSGRQAYMDKSVILGGLVGTGKILRGRIPSSQLSLPTFGEWVDELTDVTDPCPGHAGVPTSYLPLCDDNSGDHGNIQNKPTWDFPT